MVQVKPKEVDCPRCGQKPFISQLNIKSMTNDGLDISCRIECPKCFAEFNLSKDIFEFEGDAIHTWTPNHFKKGKRCREKWEVVTKAHMSSDWRDADITLIRNGVDQLNCLYALPPTPAMDKAINEAMHTLTWQATLYEQAVLRLAEREEIDENEREELLSKLTLECQRLES